MASFDDRDHAFENKFAHDEELLFKATARRNKLLGLWAAEKMGKGGEVAQAYAKEVVMVDFDEPGDDDVLRKVTEDFKAAGVSISQQEVRYEMDRLLMLAKQQIVSEG
jgi:hypothetical protein